MIAFTNNFVANLEINPYMIDAFYLLKLNYFVDLSVFNNDTYVMLVTDARSIIGGEPLSFFLAAKINSTGVLI